MPLWICNSGTVNFFLPLCVFVLASRPPSLLDIYLPADSFPLASSWPLPLGQEGPATSRTGASVRASRAVSEVPEPLSVRGGSIRTGGDIEHRPAFSTALCFEPRQWYESCVLSMDTGETEYQHISEHYPARAGHGYRQRRPWHGIPWRGKAPYTPKSEWP